MTSRGTAITLLILLLVANASATCLFSGQGPIGGSLPGGEGRWNPILAFIADQLTLPIPTANIADIRDAVLPLMAGLMLLISAVSFRKRILPNGPHSGPYEAFIPTVDPSMRLLASMTLGLLACALLSAALNRAWEYSWGWCIRIAAGLALAAVIAHTFDPRMIRRALYGIAGIAVICCTLTLAHRISRGLAYPHWPIGPITITAAMAAAWSAAAGMLGAAMLQQRSQPASALLRPILLLASGAFALTILIQTGRRAALAAWLGALFLTSCLYLARHWNIRKILLAMSAAVALAFSAGLAYFWSQAASPTREVSGPVALRLEYWRHSVELAAKNPILGTGPDTFILHMTNKVAPLRAESPHVFHSRVDPHCHNEWLQAVVELGIPGGLLYAALPLAVLVLLARRMTAPGDRADAGPILACFAGLSTIIITETASITLRGPIMPVFYWTLLGLGMAAARTPSAATTAPSAGMFLRSLALALTGIVLLLSAVLDISGSIGDVLDKPAKTQPAPRLFADRYVASMIRRAQRLHDALAAVPDPTLSDQSISAWKQIYARLPGYAPVHAALAEALLRGARRDDARNILSTAIDAGWNPYDPKVNELFAGLTNDPLKHYACARRAARGGIPDVRLQGLFVQAAASPDIVKRLLDDLHRARAIAREPTEESVRGPLVDTLRLGALLADRNKQTAAGLEDQRLAAELYRTLEKRQSRFRRSHEAEMDSFLQLALFLFDPLNKFEEALAAIREAERYAVLGISHETLADPRPEYGYVIGQVMPTEFPASLRPLWRFSALLHLIVGDDRFLEYRVYFSMPPQRWTERDLKTEVAALAGEAYSVLSRLPADQRPAHFARLLEMSRNR